MLFRRDLEDERRIWVDRGIDGRVDNFGEICCACDALLRARETRTNAWSSMESELCLDCRTQFAVQAALTDFFDLPRPVNLDQPDRYITNDEPDTARQPTEDLLRYLVLDDNG